MTRAVLALLMLVTLVIGAPANAHARRLLDDDVAGAAYDDLTGPPCIAATALELPTVERTVSIDELAPQLAGRRPTRIDVLTTAPKTSPPASRS